MLELWQGIQPLFSNITFYIACLVAALVWYGFAVAVAHLSFNNGREAVEAAIFGAWISVLITTVLATLAGYFVFPGTFNAPAASVAVAIGFCVLIVTLLFTFVLTRQS
jgi:hypothetical protein